MTRNIVHGKEGFFLSLHLLSFIVHYLIHIVSKDWWKFDLHVFPWIMASGLLFPPSHMLVLFRKSECSVRKVIKLWLLIFKVDNIFGYLNGVEDQQYWMEGKYSTLHKLFEKVMMITIWFNNSYYHFLMIFMLFQGWANEQ